MSHNLTIRNERASFAYNAQNGHPWHQLGQPMDGLQTAAAMLEAAEADFEVEFAPLYAMTANGFTELEQKATVTTDGDVLGVVSDTYHIVQNSVALSWALDIVGASGGDAVVDTCGTLLDRKRFFAYVDLGTLVLDPLGVNDRITRGLGVYTGHDGSIALTGSLSDVRWVCNNTIDLGLATAAKTVRIRHTASAEDRMAVAREALGISVEWAKQFQATAEKLLATPVTHGATYRLVDQLWPKAEADTERKLANWRQRMGTVSRLFNGPSGAENYGKNAWSLYNAVGEYVDHARSGSATTRAMASITDGSPANAIKAKAAKILLSV